MKALLCFAGLSYVAWKLWSLAFIDTDRLDNKGMAAAFWFLLTFVSIIPILASFFGTPAGYRDHDTGIRVGGQVVTEKRWSPGSQGDGAGWTAGRRVVFFYWLTLTLFGLYFLAASMFGAPWLFPQPVPTVYGDPATESR
jgi:hypothetical protein